MSFRGIREHDLVKFRSHSGKLRTGKAQRAHLYPTHVVVSECLGHGGPRPLRVVDDSNYVSHKRARWGIGNISSDAGKEARFRYAAGMR